MSTRPDDQLVNVLSQWLARHVDDGALLKQVDAVDPAALSERQRDAVEELRAELERADGRGDLEMVVRETLESLALG